MPGASAKCEVLRVRPIQDEDAPTKGGGNASSSGSGGLGEDRTDDTILNTASIGMTAPLGKQDCNCANVSMVEPTVGVCE